MRPEVHVQLAAIRITVQQNAKKKKEMHGLSTISKGESVSIRNTR